ncbi:MAG: molybdopterin biosynthesis protein MoeB, partial [Alcaligenaceae bacterium]
AKVDSAAQALLAINPGVQVRPLRERVDAARLDALVAQASVVLDCSDNYATRQAVNAACVRHGKPLVAGAAIRLDGQVTVVDPTQPEAPCYACLFSPHASFEEAQCATLGVFSPMVGIIGSMQAAEALKLLVGMGGSLAGYLLMLDGRTMEWTRMRTVRDPACPVCGTTSGAER